MNHEYSIQLAQELLDGEFEGANNNPVAYCEAMGWDENSPGTHKAKKKKGQLSPSADDIENLASIIDSCGTDDTEDITERNSVSDFLCNCVASHIIS